MAKTLGKEIRISERIYSSPIGCRSCGSSHDRRSEFVKCGAAERARKADTTESRIIETGGLEGKPQPYVTCETKHRNISNARKCHAATGKFHNREDYA